MIEYPGRLHHRTPAWVHSGAKFHVRIRARSPLLTDPVLASKLIAGVRTYHSLGKWWCELLVLMPDHLHAILAFPTQPGMSETIRAWKRGATRFQGVAWQEGYFDHRLRSPEEASETWHYIRRNPVVLGLCAQEESWPHWWSALLPNALLDPAHEPTR